MASEMSVQLGSLWFLCCTARIFESESGLCHVRNALSAAEHVLLVLSSASLAQVLRLALDAPRVNCTVITGHETLVHATAIVHEQEVLLKGHFASRLALRELERHIRTIAAGETLSLRSGTTEVKVCGENTTKNDSSALDAFVLCGASRVLRYTRPQPAHPRVEAYGVVSAACGRRMFSMLNAMVRSRGAVTVVSPMAREMLVLADMYRGYVRDFEVLVAPRSQYGLSAHLGTGRLRLVTELADFANALAAPRTASVTFASPAVIALLSELGIAISCVSLGEADGEHVDVSVAPNQTVTLHLNSGDAENLVMAGPRMLIPAQATADLCSGAILISPVGRSAERHIHLDNATLQAQAISRPKLSVTETVDCLHAAGLYPVATNRPDGTTLCELPALGIGIRISEDALHVHSPDAVLAGAILSLFVS